MISSLRQLLLFAWGFLHLCCLWSLLLSQEAFGFVGPSVRISNEQRHHPSLQAQRTICTFEASDFPLSTGEWPYGESDMKRADETDDSRFYESPRFVTHIDERAITSLTEFYKEEFTSASSKNANRGLDILDLCSSWISHFPKGRQLFGRVVGVGMNEEELKANKKLTEYYVQDLNKNPSFVFAEDESFDVITNVVSVDYLTKPREVFKEMHRVLRPGGIALMSFSNRCFATKAVSMWLQADDIDRMAIVASYFHYTAKWSSLEALDVLPPPGKTPKPPSLGDMFSNPASGFAWMQTAAAVQKANQGDPLFVIKAVKNKD